MLTQPAGGAAQEFPDKTLEPFSRLRSMAAAGALSASQREALVATLRGPLTDFAHAVRLALEALDGPDPEVAILYLTDAGATARQAMTLLDAKLL